MEYDLKIYTENIEPAATAQIYALMAQPPFQGAKVRIMPDVHFGKGCVVGFTSTMTTMAIPNVIGVDIGCGMLTAELGILEMDEKQLAEMDCYIKENIPSGSAIYKEAQKGAESLVKKLRCYKELRDVRVLFCSLGSLGGGNHFIEMDKDEEGNYYLVIHSGSRSLGLQVAHIYQNRAVAYCKNKGKEEKDSAVVQLKNSGRQGDIPDALAEISAKYAKWTKTPADMCFLEGKDLEDYLHDVRICQEFASMSRKIMADKICKFLGVFNYSSFETVHNFIDEENIIRKGAIPAKKGQRVLIPMNMRDGCILGVGKGNPDWNHSAPHGAGRLLTRGEAKELISVEEFKEAMEGIFTTTANASTIDESPMAYKPMDEILHYITPAIEIEKMIKPIYNFKAANNR